jgi:hypothetical protein
MPTIPPRVHYAVGHGSPACGAIDKHEMTAVPRKVTCERCISTPSYKHMMEYE